MGRIKVNPAFKHPRGRIGGELVHDERICGRCAVRQKQSAKTKRQQMKSEDFHFVDFFNNSGQAKAKTVNCGSMPRSVF
jgi:hypothetical protein